MWVCVQPSAGGRSNSCGGMAIATSKTSNFCPSSVCDNRSDGVPPATGLPSISWLRSVVYVSSELYHSKKLLSLVPVTLAKPVSEL